MPSDELSGRIENLERVLAGLNTDALRKLDLENLDLGSFLRLYAGPPGIADIESRSSIREDTVIREVARMLGNSPETKTVHVLDACCGEGSLGLKLISSFQGKTKRIQYTAVDQDRSCIACIKARSHEFSSFAAFRHLQRQAWDLADFAQGSVDLAVLNNALHEIAPHQYPMLFDRLNSLLDAENGRVCVVDMEALPPDAPEAIAINWHGVELERIVTAGRLAVELTRHPKATTVYQAHIRHSPDGLNSDAMRSEIQSVLLEKMRRAIAARRVLESRLGDDVGRHKEWLVLTGTIARYTDELLALGYFGG